MYADYPSDEMCYEVGENRGSGEIGESETVLSDKITFSQIQRTRNYETLSKVKFCWYDPATVCFDDDVEWWKTMYMNVKLAFILELF